MNLNLIESSNTARMGTPVFSKQRLPMLITSLSDSTAVETICTMRNALFDGADGFMLHMEKLAPSKINEVDLKRIMDYACDKPLFTMNYRKPDDGKSDEQRMNEQLMAVRAGASMIDMMGDMFDPSPMELSRDPRAIDRQRQVIADVHALGGEVLMSSHTWVYMPPEELIAHAKTLEDRGADFVKIAMSVRTEDEAMNAMRATSQVKNELNVPFLHVCMGQHGKLHRAVSPMLGSCFALCVQTYTAAGHKEKPLLRAEKAVFDNLDWMPARDPCLGAGAGSRVGER